MTKRDTGWRPKGGIHPYKGREVWEYELGPHEVNVGEVDGDVSISEEDGSADSDREE